MFNFHVLTEEIENICPRFFAMKYSYIYSTSLKVYNPLIFNCEKMKIVRNSIKFGQVEHVLQDALEMKEALKLK